MRFSITEPEILGIIEYLHGVDGFTALPGFRINGVDFIVCKISVNTKKKDGG